MDFHLVARPQSGTFLNYPEDCDIQFDCDTFPGEVSRVIAADLVSLADFQFGKVAGRSFELVHVHSINSKVSSLALMMFLLFGTACSSGCPS